MIEEAYVSFETARLLKEKGFNGLCKSFWVDYETKQPIIFHTKKERSYGADNIIILAPTQQMVMRWLREKGYYIKIQYQRFFKEYFPIIVPIKTNMDAQFLSRYSTYEEACEAAIKYCLENLI